MAVKLFGVDPSINEQRWSELFDMIAPQVVTGLGTTVKTPSTRQVTVAGGRAVAAGVYVVVDAAQDVTLDANNSDGFNRTDIIALQLDWSQTQDTGGTLVAVKGTPGGGALPPALIQTPGVLWQIPLAQVLVRSGIGQLDPADVKKIQPLPRRNKVFRRTPPASTINKDAAAKVVDTLEVTDPGWPYRIRVYGTVNWANTDAGFGAVQVLLDGEQLTSGRAPGNNQGPAIIRPETSTTRTGPAVVQLQIVSVLATGQQATTAPYSGWTVEVIPA